MPDSTRRLVTISIRSTGLAQKTWVPGTDLAKAKVPPIQIAPSCSHISLGEDISVLIRVTALSLLCHRP